MSYFDYDEFKRLKDSVNIEYKNTGHVYSPALKAKIVFNSNGITHLYYKNNRTGRSKNVQYNKLRFFREAVNISKIATTIQEYRRIALSNKCKNGQNKISVTELFAFWAIISFKKKTRIKIIVRRVGGDDGQYHFWSLMPYWNLRHKDRVIGSQDIENE